MLAMSSVTLGRGLKAVVALEGIETMFIASAPRDCTCGLKAVVALEGIETLPTFIRRCSHAVSKQ